MARFILITGSETSQNAWASLLKILTESGHTCYIHGVDEITWGRDPEVDLEALAGEIGRESNTILVGHSIAGLLLPTLGELLGAICEVYVAALIPQPGTSVFDRVLMGEDLFIQSWLEGYEEMRRDDNPQIAHREFLESHLFHDCPPGAVERHWRQSTLPLRKIYETVFRAPHASRVQHFIVCTEDRTLQPGSQRRSAELLPFARISKIVTGHCPHIADPSTLAELILSNARVLSSIRQSFD